MEKQNPLDEEGSYMFHSLKYDKKVQEYLSKYHEQTTDTFLRDYVRQKQVFMEKAESVAAKMEERADNILATAQWRFLDIQLKKLFDIMLQWNANLFKHESIEILRDFEQWEYDLFNCPFLTPVSKSEFDLYMQYAKSDEFELEKEINFIFLTSYFDSEYSKFDEEEAKAFEEKMIEESGEDDFSECEEWDKDVDWGDDDKEPLDDIDYWGDKERSEFPRWFAYNNEHSSNGTYLELPQIRAVKEHFYLRLQEEEELAAWDEEQNEDLEPVKNGVAACSYYHVKKFILACEDKDVLDKFTKYYDANPHLLMGYNEKRQRHEWLEKHARKAFENLVNIHKLNPCPANKDWRVALINTYKQYQKKQVIETLPYVYEDYCMRLATNIGFDWEIERPLLNLFANDYIRKNILRGRFLNGEPEDFNF